MSVDASNALLAWYAVDKRVLPWRAEEGETPDPYRVWLSEIMLQQTTVAHARPYYEAFTRRWPSVAALAAADEGEVMAAWAGLGYYARARNLIACAKAVAAGPGGRFPATEPELRKLPGIGRYTAAAIAAIAFGRRAVVVDANVERVVARLFALHTPLPAAKAEIYRLADSITPDADAGDFAQAMMDLGATICIPRSPDCGRCPLAALCQARRSGVPDRFPIKAATTPKPRREGVAYWFEHDGHVLLVRRPPRGLLGGMLALPTEEAPTKARWREAGSIDHVFTHFALTMRLLCADAEHSQEGTWWPIARLDEAGLPTLFARLASLSLQGRGGDPLRQQWGGEGRCGEGESVPSPSHLPSAGGPLHETPLRPLPGEGARRLIPCRERG
ncbi:MAG TPA: A/G-specific adenine glycosylase [Allosphingosinicella sp.]|nr:A/G-specific adenine glycosylase [Allosphingosinicella sp.]